jgi:hypothetical protein
MLLHGSKTPTLRACFLALLHGRHNPSQTPCLHQQTVRAAAVLMAVYPGSVLAGQMSSAARPRRAGKERAERQTASSSSR